MAHLSYFTNFFRCLFKKRRNKHFENFQLWKIYPIRLVKWTTHFNCWSQYQNQESEFIKNVNLDILIQGIYSCHKISIHKLDTMTPLSLIVPWHLTYKCSWVLMGALECSLVFLSDTECSSSWFIDKWKMLNFKINSYYWFVK